VLKGVLRDAALVTPFGKFDAVFLVGRNEVENESGELPES
jgi:hypothetical protein